MSGFPPPSPRKNLLDNPLVSPFSLDESSEEDKTTSNVQTSETGSGEESNSDTSTGDISTSPRLVSRPSQSLMNARPTASSEIDDGSPPQSHTSPVVTSRSIGDEVQQASVPPADLPPPPPQLTIGQSAAQTLDGDPGAVTTTAAWLSSASQIPLRSVTTTTTPTGQKLPTTLTTTTTSTTTTTTTTPITTRVIVGSSASTSSDNGKGKTTESNYRLPELEGIKGTRVIHPVQLAKQLVYAESFGYNKPLKGANVDSIFRAKVWLKVQTDENGKSITQPEKENAISQFSEPFMKHHFDTPALKTALNQVTQNYKKQADAAIKLYNEFEPPEFNKNKKSGDLMRPIIAPLIEHIFGKENNLQTSGMPLPVLAAMLALDEEVQVWYKKNGGNDPDELLRARKNALTGIFGVRAFIPGYAVQLHNDKTVAEGHYRPLTGFLMAHMNRNYQQFLDSVLACPKEERDRIKREAAITESRPVLHKTEREKIDQAKELFQKRKPSSLLVRLKDTVDSIVKSTEKNEPTSPRRGLQRRETVDKDTQFAQDKEPKSPRSLGNAQKNLGAENAETREKKKTRERQAVLDTYLKSRKLTIVKDLTELADVIRGINKKIGNASSEEYRSFRSDPDRFFQGFLKDLIADIQAKGAVPSPALQKFFIQLSEELGISDSE